MKRFLTIVLFLAVGAFGLTLSWSCQSSSKSPDFPTGLSTVAPLYGAYTNTPTFTPTPTVTSTPTPATVQLVTSKYVSGGVTLSGVVGVTIMHGNSVIWDATNATHPLYIDNGASCSVSNNTAFPMTQAFPAAGTYYFHCGAHATGCNPSAISCPVTASSCTGEASFVVAQ